MSKFSIFGRLMAEQASAEKLPNVLFTDNSDLRGSLSRLGLLTSVESVVPDEKISSSVEMFGEAISDKVNNGEYTNVFDQIATIFGSKLQSGVESLRNVKKDVNRLIRKMNYRVDDRIAHDPDLSRFFNVHKELTMNKVMWDKFDAIDEHAVRATVHNEIGQEINAPITENYISQAINKIPYANNYNTVPLSTVNLSKSKFDKIVNAVSNRLPNIGASVIAGVLRNTLELSESNMRAAVAAARAFANGSKVERINHVITNAVNYIEIYNCLDKSILDVASSTYEELSKHVTCLEKVATTLLYICTYYRREVWSNSLLVPGPYINPDTLDTYEQCGGSITNVVHHVARFFSEIPVPVKGVSGDFIARSTESVNKELSENAVRQTRVSLERKKQIEHEVFVEVSTEYLREHANALSMQFTFRNNPSKYADAVYDTYANVPHTLKFYRMILNSCHINGMASSIFDRLNAAYTKHTAEMGELSSVGKEEIEIKVYSDMIAEYLVNSGVLIV